MAVWCFVELIAYGSTILVYGVVVWWLGYDSRLLWLVVGFCGLAGCSGMLASVVLWLWLDMLVGRW